MSEEKDLQMENATGDQCRYLLTALVKDEKAFEELVSLIKGTKVTVEKTENLGPRSLAFAVNKHRELLLTSIFFQATGSDIQTIQHLLKNEDAVERFLLTTWKGDLEAPKRPTHGARRAAVATKEENVQS